MEDYIEWVTLICLNHPVVVAILLNKADFFFLTKGGDDVYAVCLILVVMSWRNWRGKIFFFEAEDPLPRCNEHHQPGKWIKDANVNQLIQLIHLYTGEHTHTFIARKIYQKKHAQQQ